MRGVVFTGNRQLELRDFPDPTPGPGEVVLEIKASGMCGSDLKFYRAVSFMSPFGGYKDSGIGRENGIDAIREYLQVKSVWINTGAVSANPFVMR